jgi:hypothetical protein
MENRDVILQRWRVPRSESARSSASPSGLGNSSALTCWTSVSSAPRLAATRDLIPISTSLVVVQPDGERAALEDRVIDIAFDVNLEFGLYLSPRVVTPEILNDPVWSETPFLKNVVRESVPL